MIWLGIFICVPIGACSDVREPLAGLRSRGYCERESGREVKGNLWSAEIYKISRLMVVISLQEVRLKEWEGWNECDGQEVLISEKVLKESMDDK